MEFFIILGFRALGFQVQGLGIRIRSPWSKAQASKSIEISVLVKV